MVCGNVLIDVKAPKDETSSMATLELTFFVLSMDKTGHIIWPTAFEAPTQAQLDWKGDTYKKGMVLFHNSNDVKKLLCGKNISTLRTA